MKKSKKIIVTMSLMLIASFLCGCLGQGINAENVKYVRISNVKDFSLISPSDGEIVNGRTPIFEWENAGANALYTLEVARDENFEVLSLKKSNLTSTKFKTVSALALNTTYFWRVTAYGSNDKVVSDVMKFRLKFSGALAEETVPLDKNMVCNEGGMALNHCFENGRLNVSWGKNPEGWGVLREDVSCFLDSGDAIYVKYKYSGAESISLRFLEQDSDLWVCDLPLKKSGAFIESIIPYKDFTIRKDESFGDGLLTFDNVRRFDLVVNSFEEGSCSIETVKCVNREDYVVDKVSRLSLPADISDYIVNPAGYRAKVETGEFVGDGSNAVRISYDDGINDIGWSVVSYYCDCELVEGNTVSFDYLVTGFAGNFMLRFVEEDGDMWIAQFNAIPGLASNVSVPYSDFILREDQSAGDGKVSLKKLVKIEFVAEAYGEGSVSFGNIVFSKEKERENSLLSFYEIFGDYMVLQRDKTVKIKGSCEENAAVTVTFIGNDYPATVTGTEWECRLPSMQAGGDYTIQVSDGINVEKIEHVTFGDVYLFAGQSNMLFKLAQASDDKNDINNENVRLFFQKENKREQPQKNCKNGYWTPAINDTALGTSAVAWYTANIIEKQEHVPIGILYSAVGDTFIEAWMSREAYSGSRTNANGYYNGMINPLTYTDISGIVWYQGENNCGWPEQYRSLLSKMIDDMRVKFNDETLPFYVVSLPVYNHPYNWAFIRESQEKVCLAKDNVYLVNTLDNGDADNIHPTQKLYIAERLSNLMLKHNYGRDIDADMPYAESYAFIGNEAIITIKNGKGLELKENDSFEIAGRNGVFYKGSAMVRGNTVAVTSPFVSEAAFVRYAFSSVTKATLYNGNGLPVNSFRSYETSKDVRINLSVENVNKDFYAGNNAGYGLTNDGEKLVIDYNNANGAGWGIVRINAFTPINGGDYMIVKLTKTGASVTHTLRLVEVDGDIWYIALNFDANGVACVKYSDFTWMQGWGDKNLDRDNLIEYVELTFDGCYGTGQAVIEYVYSGDKVESVEKEPTIVSVIDNFDDESCVDGWTLSHEYNNSAAVGMNYTTEEKASGNGGVYLKYAKKLGNSYFDKSIETNSLHGSGLSFWIKGDDECVVFIKITDRNGVVYSICIEKPTSEGKRYSFDFSSIGNDSGSSARLTAENIKNVRIIVQDWSNGTSGQTAGIYFDEFVTI